MLTLNLIIRTQILNVMMIGLLRKQNSLNIANVRRLKACYEIDPLISQPAMGAVPQDWATWIAKKCRVVSVQSTERLSTNKTSRQDLLKLTTDKSFTTQEVVLSILAWGGMRRDNGLKSIRSFKSWSGICEKLRDGTLSRCSAYGEFKGLRARGELKGMGPAFFTKLIFFLHPSHNGYIMDQWTSSSINILYTVPFVRLTQRYYVCDGNTPLTYEKFCKAIEELALRLSIHPACAELMLFSQGGRSKHCWRTFVMQHRSIK